MRGGCDRGVSSLNHTGSCGEAPYTRVDDFTITVNWLTIEGAVASATCGAMMRRNVAIGDIPTA